MKERESVLDKVYRVVCFSSVEATSLDEILLWSHYTNKHSGVRIGFEFPQDLPRSIQLIKIKYQDERVKVDMSNILDGIHLLPSLLESSKVKSNAWKYECEYRLLTVPWLHEERILENQIAERFVKFPREWVKSVDFGLRCPPYEIQKLSNLLKADYPHITCRKANFHETEYALDYSEIIQT